MTLYLKKDIKCSAVRKLGSSIGDALKTASKSSHLLILVGYVGEAGLSGLLSLGTPLAGSKLIVGMAKEGLSHSQISLLEDLESIGWEIRLAKTLNHSKLYLAPLANWGSIGSSNLDSVFSDSKLELDQAISKDSYANSISYFEVCWNQGISLTDWLLNPIIKKNTGSIFSDEDFSTFVDKVSVGFYQPISSEFTLQVKMENASNFNICYAAPRMAKKGKGQPRNWYEMEINIPTKVGLMPDFPPVGTEFTIITDDGYSFQCKRNGTGGKSLQSTPNLQILGKWLKGKLMAQGIIKFNEKGTSAMLDKFGTHDIVLKKLDKENHWLMCFGVKP